MRKLFGMMEIFSILIVVVVTEVINIHQTHQTTRVHLKRVNFTTCKSYFSKPDLKIIQTSVFTDHGILDHLTQNKFSHFQYKA